MKRKFLVPVAALLASGMVGIISARPTYAATNVVTTCSGDPTMSGSLPYEVASAAAGDTITFGQDCPSTSPIMLSTVIAISKNMTIDGDGHNIVIDGGGVTQLFSVSSSTPGYYALITLKDLTLTHGIGAQGGAIYNTGAGYVTITNSILSHNAATSGGGAIYNGGTNGTVVISGSTFSNDSAPSGGAIYNTTVWGSASVAGSTFSGDSATLQGGAIYNSVSNLTVSGSSSFSDNAAGSGGAIYNLGDVTVESGGTFSGNSATSGGAIYNDVNGFTSITGGAFSSNSVSCGSFSCSSDGGAIYSYEGNLSITSSTLSGNSSTCGGTFCFARGGAIYNNFGLTSIGTSTLAGNAASCSGSGCDGEGGAVSNHGTTTITGSTLSGNSASYGGAIDNANSLSIGGSIVASTSGGNCAQYSVNDNGYNLEWTGSTSTGYSCGFSSTNHDIVGQDPKFVTDGSGTPLLASNGGPTQTIALQPASPAVDYIPTGHVGCSASGGKDQRGVTRPDNGEASCDIGAYEYDGPDQQTQTVNWPAPSQTTYTYGDGAFTVSATASSGLPVSFSIDASSSRVCSAGSTNGATITILSAGTCKVLADQSGNTGYLAAPEVSQSFTINKATLFVKANDKTMTYGGTVPTFDASVNGLTNGDTFASLGGGCGATANGNAAGASTSAGTYTGAITCSGVTTTNYSVTYTAGTLTVNQATSTTTVGASGSPTMQGQTVTFTATVSPQYSGTPSGTVAFYDGTTALGTATLTNGQASLSTSTLTIGSHTITARYNGANNFLGSSTIKPLTQTVNTNLSSYPMLSNGAYNLQNATLSGAYLVGANLPNASASNATLSGANLSGATLTSATLTQALFQNSTLTGANLTGANLSQANLSGAVLSNANLTNASLSQANLKGATGMRSVTLGGVTWSKTTCPDGTISDKDGGTCLGHL